ncbi:MAG: DUF397 domain-containing protein [Stackebrandtia sp.]
MSLTSLPWRKPSRSHNNGACVEAACIFDAPTAAIVAVRDSKLGANDFPALSMQHDDWAGFLAAIRSGSLKA